MVFTNFLKYGPSYGPLEIYNLHIDGDGKIDLPTSSHFARIVKALSPKSYKNILEDILYKRTEFGNNAEMKHKRLVKREALALFGNLYKDHTLQKCGLFIDKVLPYLCASPLRLYGNDHIISIKCPLTHYNKKFDDVIQKIPFWKKEGGSWTINKKSEWYIELQGKLHTMAF